MDIRYLTVLIVRKDRRYLVGKDVFGRLKWSDSPYDAWKTRIRAMARSVQEKVGGEILLFNPAIGETKEIKLSGQD